MQNKPTASNHMLWFFLIPGIVFIAWISYRLINVSFSPQKPKALFEQLERIKVARSPGDRWQAAYALAQNLQAKIQSGEINQIDDKKKDRLYRELDQLLKEHSTDNRLKRYLLLTLGQMGDVRALPALKNGLKDEDSEIRFFSAWGFVDLLNKNRSSITQDHIDEVFRWTKSDDPALKKIAISFLVQQEKARELHNKLLVFLKDQNVEIRWNTAVAFATMGKTSAKETLLELFDLGNLRAVEYRSQKALHTMVKSAYIAAQNIWDKDFEMAVQKLRSQLKENTPEANAIQAALKKST